MRTLPSRGLLQFLASQPLAWNHVSEVASWKRSAIERGSQRNERACGDYLDQTILPRL